MILRVFWQNSCSKFFEECRFPAAELAEGGRDDEESSCDGGTCRGGGVVDVL